MTQEQDAERLKEMLVEVQNKLKILQELENKERIRIAEVEVLRDNLKQKISEYERTMLEAADLKRRLDKLESGDRQSQSFRSGEDLPEPENRVEVSKGGEIYKL